MPTWVRSLVLVIAILFAIFASTSSLSAEDWPTFLGPRHNSTSNETGLLRHWQKEGPKVLWQKKLGTGYGIGSISDGKFYQFDRYGNANRLVVFDAKTGEELWTYEYPTQYDDYLGYNNGPRCSPIIDGDRVYLYGAEGELHCVSIPEKKLLWKRNLSQEYMVVPNFFGVGSSPVIFQDKLLVMVGGSPEKFKGLGPYDIERVDGNGSGIVALDKLTGKEVYKLSDELASYASLTLAEIDGRLGALLSCGVACWALIRVMGRSTFITLGVPRSWKASMPALRLW